jgi:hypothetical protein
MMKVKTFTAMGQKGSSKKVNHFLDDPSFHVVSIKFSNSFGYLGAMVVYQ